MIALLAAVAVLSAAAGYAAGETRGIRIGRSRAAAEQAVINAPRRGP